MNVLKHETSPYLLQHAENPVHWQAWNQEALDKARSENKPLLVSIGYSACHWCHVMEHECFESEEVARVMNTHFVNIKVDREERPDVDRSYMQALQLMTGGGGWPLNVLCLPDGRPFWGATYMSKDSWILALSNLAELYEKDPDKVIAYAEHLSEGVRMLSLYTDPETAGVLEMNAIQTLTEAWKENLDYEWGGRKGAPKFMMPVLLDYALHYTWENQDPEMETWIQTTLFRMASGGLYDCVGGGFSRYSVDDRWHVPHFEKMLYDNALLVSIYSKAYRRWRDPLYRTVILETLNWMRKELKKTSPLYASSLDADSHNALGHKEEGAYYVWTEQELKQVFGPDYERFSRIFHIDTTGHWEEGKYVLFRTKSLEEIAKSEASDKDSIDEEIKGYLSSLRSYREKREAPALDDKCLTSWNALVISALCEAGRSLNEQPFIKEAVELAQRLQSLCMDDRMTLFHSWKNGSARIEGFLEDYAFFIQATLDLYEVSSRESWLFLARDVTLKALDSFSASESPLLFFSKASAQTPVSDQFEREDNVIPASNSVMAHNLWRLSAYFGRQDWKERSKQMLTIMKGDLESYPGSHANWLRLALLQQGDFKEIAVCGPRAMHHYNTLLAAYIPSVVLACSDNVQSTIPLFHGRWDKNQTRIFVCKEGACETPVFSAEEILTTLKR